MGQPIEQYRNQIKKEISDCLSKFEYMINNKENRDSMKSELEGILSKYIDNDDFKVNVSVVVTSPIEVEVIAADTFTENIFKEIYK